MRQIVQLRKSGVDRITLYISADRPTPAVIEELEWIKKHTPQLTVILDTAPGAVVSPGGLKWMEVLCEQYKLFRARAEPLDACMLWDDDALFSPGAIRELRGHLRCLEHDRVDALSLFCWNHPEKINARFPAHWSTCLFRVYPGDEYPTDFEVHCPLHCSRSTRRGVLRNPWLNFGYMDADERDLTWQAQKAAGKIDAHTLCLVRPPELQDLPREYRYKRIS